MEKKKKVIMIISIIVIIIAIIGISIPMMWYHNNVYNIVLKQDTKVKIELGSGSNKIASILKENGVISNELAFKIYVRWNKISKFQAGEYDLVAGMTIPQIVEALQTGKVYRSDSSITFLEGKNMRWVANKIQETTNNTAQDVYNLLEDEEYINSLIEKYWFLTDEIKNKDIYYPLEGYLWPETYSFIDKDITVKEIFEKLLNQTEKELEPYKEKLQNSSITVHQYLTIASIVENEAMVKEDRKGVASVIYNRIKKNMNIGSDVTTYYAVKVDIGERDLYKAELNTYNPYNTRGPRMAGKIPIGPISSVSISSLEAAIEPETTDNLYFVADKNGKVYFTKTNEEHEAKIKDLKDNGLWYEF